MMIGDGMMMMVVLVEQVISITQEQENPQENIKERCHTIVYSTIV